MRLTKKGHQTVIYELNIFSRTSSDAVAAVPAQKQKPTQLLLANDLEFPSRRPETSNFFPKAYVVSSSDGSCGFLF